MLGSSYGRSHLNPELAALPPPLELPSIPKDALMEHDLSGTYWSQKRHDLSAYAEHASLDVIPWRTVTERVKVATAALVLCLKIGVDPPDNIKPTPHPILESWLDPFSIDLPIEVIGNQLTQQYEALKSNVRYESLHDPSYKYLRYACRELRNFARGDGVLFHYNGHGVLQPTSEGLWCYNDDSTEYTWFHIRELFQWIQSPAVYVWDCSAAGRPLSAMAELNEHRDIQFAACAADEILPTCPDLPADMFTSCLTTPIQMAVRHYIINNPQLGLDIDASIPGDLRDRTTPLGELNWIFNAIADAIAWSVFSAEDFARMYRSDPLVSSLSRNFLLAERLMKDYSCTPRTSPPLPSTYLHPLWRAWNDALESFVFLVLKHPDPATREPSQFFSNQLKAFEIWLSRDPAQISQRPPEQFPMLLHILLSPLHRVRTLILLCQFADIGPWAVHHMLSIGFVPYLVRLLQTSNPELRPVLIFLWARIIAVDPSLQTELLTKQSYRYFSKILTLQPHQLQSLPNAVEHQAMCAFIMTMFARDFPKGQKACWDETVFKSCLDKVDESHPLLSQWAALCIGQMWDSVDEGKVIGARAGGCDKLLGLLLRDSVEVRCAALFALGTFLGASGSARKDQRGGRGSGSMDHYDEFSHLKLEVEVVARAMDVVKDDASPICRKESLVLISCLVKEWRGHFIVCAWLYWEEERKKSAEGRKVSFAKSSSHRAFDGWLAGLEGGNTTEEESRALISSVYTIFVTLLNLSVDPHPEVAKDAQLLVDYIMSLLLDSHFTRLPSSSLNRPEELPISSSSRPLNIPAKTSTPWKGSLESTPGLSPSINSSPSSIDTPASSSPNALKRTSSFANTLKSLARNFSFPGILRTPPTDSIYDPHGIATVLPESSPLYSDGHKTIQSNPRSPSPAFTALDIIAALVEEDMERLRVRKKSTRENQRSRRNSGGSANSSRCSFILLGIGTGVDAEDYLPLKSRFFNWSRRYFVDSQMLSPESERTGSKEYNYQLWRRRRNAQTDSTTRKQAEIGVQNPWNKPVATLKCPPNPSALAFHSFDQHLVVANERDVTIWDWACRKQIWNFENGNPGGTRVTSLCIINQEVGGLITTGASDGTVRLWEYQNSIDDQEHGKLVSAFRGSDNIVPMQHGPGIVLEWKQAVGRLLVGGDSRMVVAWDAEAERQSLSLQTGSNSPLTSLVCDPAPSQMFAAGFGDGCVKLFDEREKLVVGIVGKHTSWIQNIRPHPTRTRQFMSADLEGQVVVWDVRNPDTPIETLDFMSGLCAFDVHQQMPVFAGTSAITSTNWKRQDLLVHSLQTGDTLMKTSIGTGLNTPPVAVPSYGFPRRGLFAFHPKEMLFGVGTPGGSIVLGSSNVFGDLL
ncbi:Target of rapamycin complex 1 subunit kog1 [Stygiomarasmius scandens]|uniref:Target of rapamycin complex 1 subunit kog1 n=1 Tax=Marasmiellus scandens TaxID=2682957 RepID=A0ABR1IPI4_9AGAR